MIKINLYKISPGKKVTQEEIAKAIGMSPATVNRLFNDEKFYDFKLSTINKICKYFGCSVHDIIEEIPD